MNDVTVLTAEALLAIGLTEPERLFSGDEDAAKREFRALAARWHPDRDADAEHGTGVVFQHVSRLYAAAAQKRRSGLWQTPGLLELRASDGAHYQIRYRRERAFELGRLFVGKEIAAYVIEKEYADLFQNALRTLARLPCADARMAAEVGHCLPEVVRHFETEDRCVLVLRKKPDQVPLRDLLDHLGGRMDARHVAWIISSLLNLACYLDYARLAHNAIATDTWFVSPSRHSGALLGGWWYAVRQGQPMRAAPESTVRHAPVEVLAHRRGDCRTDLELIRALGRELLGEVGDARLAHAQAAPPPMIDWLQRPSDGCAVRDYRTWMDRVLRDSFGERRFVKLDVDVEQLY